MPHTNNSQRIRVGRTVVDPGGNRIITGRSSRKVRPREMQVLMHLIRSGAGVASREELLNSVWTDVVVNDDALTLAISRLRQAFSDNPRNPAYIETIPKHGYRLVAETETLFSAEPAVGFRRILRYRIALTVLAVLVLLVSALFWAVRSEYEKAATLQRPPQRIEVASE